MPPLVVLVLFEPVLDVWNFLDRIERIFESNSVPNTKMKNPCSELKKAKAMWIPLFVDDIMVPIPKDQVSPNKGVKMTTHLRMTSSVCLSSLWAASPTPRLNILNKTTITIIMLMETIIKAGITKASRACVSNQLSQQALSFLMYSFPGAVTATVITAIIRGHP